MFNKPRGTKTWFGTELQKKQLLQDKLSKWARLYGFSQIENPTFEYTDLFISPEEKSENILEKELFFLEGRKYALIPELTAPISRSIFSEKLLSTQPTPLKYFYISKCFRYERPQKGRYREFTQFGVEIINAKSIIYEIELIGMINSFFQKELNLTNTVLRINYLSNLSQKQKWASKLTSYFSKYLSLLSETSQDRVKSNPIRILDDRRDSSLEIVQKAPKISEFFSEEDVKTINTIKRYLNQLQIKYKWDETLVRGLNYYTGLVFEWSYNNLSIAGGGRYDELFSKFERKYDTNKIHSIGLALGIERLKEVLEVSGYRWILPVNKRIYFCSLLKNVDPQMIQFIIKLRESDISVESNWELNSLESHFKYSHRLQIEWLLIYGERERENKEIILKQQNKNYMLILSLSNFENLVREIKKILEVGI